MQKHGEINIFLTLRYLRFLVFVRELSEGKSNRTRRNSLRLELNGSAKIKVAEQQKPDLLMGIQRQVNNFLQKIAFANLDNEKISLETFVPEEEYRYLLARIFSDNDICESRGLELLVMSSFHSFDQGALSRKQSKNKGEFQDIVSLMRSILNDLGKEEN